MFRLNKYIHFGVFILILSLQCIVASDIDRGIVTNKLTLIHPDELEKNHSCYDHVEKRYLTLLEKAVTTQDIVSLYYFVSSAHFDNRKLEMNRAISLAKKVEKTTGQYEASCIVQFLLNSGVQDCNT